MSSTSANPAPASGLFKNVARSSAVYSLPFILQRIASVLMLPIYTRFLSTSDYGIMDLLVQTLTVISLLFGIRISAAIGYFYFQASSPQGRSKVVGTAVFGAAMIGLAGTAVTWPLAPLLSRLVFGSTAEVVYFHIALLTWPCGFALEALYSLLRVQNRSTAYTVSSVVSLVLMVSTILILVAALKLRVAGILYAGLIVGAVLTVGISIDIFRNIRPTFDFGTLGPFLRYSMALGFSGLAGLVINFGDRFVLPHYRPLSELGVYVLAYKIGMLMTFVYGSFDTYWSSQVYEIMKRHDSDWVFKRMLTYVVLGISAAALGLTVAARPTLRILAAKPFQGAAAIVPVIVLAYYIRSIGDFFRTLFLVAGRPSYDAITYAISAVVCAISYLLLIPPFGAWGAAWATVAAVAVLTSISTVWTYRIRHYEVEWARLAKIAAAGAAGLLPWLLLSTPSLAGQIAVAVFSFALFPAVLWVLRFATPGELDRSKSFLVSSARRLGWGRSSSAAGDAGA
jgi:O-antigen/teichoic acid export membrane protein